MPFSKQMFEDWVNITFLHLSVYVACLSKAIVKSLWWQSVTVVWSSSFHIKNIDTQLSLRQSPESIQKLDHYSGMYLPSILML